MGIRSRHRLNHTHKGAQAPTVNPATTILVALAGLLAGGVINWLADDLPHTYRLHAPHYPDGARRPRLAWLGVLAFALGRRASPGGARLTWRHPLTEIATAALFVATVAETGITAREVFVWGHVAILMLITVIDLEHRMILFAVIIPACVYALAGAALLGPALAPRVTFSDYLIGGAAGFALFAVMYLGGMAFSAVMASARGEPLEEVAFGYGDVLLAMLSGFMLGWQALIFAVTIAVFAGGAGALLYLGFRLAARGRYEMFTALPYGQYIVLGTLIMLLWRAPVVQFLQRMG